MTSVYVSLVVAQLASFAVTLFLTSGDPFEKALFWVLVFVGLAWAMVGATTLGMWHVAKQRRDSAEFQDGGVYRYVRHPIYTGLMTVALAFVIAGPTLSGSIAFLAVVATTYARARVEELTLAEKTPEYAEYQRRTKRFIPFVI